MGDAPGLRVARAAVFAALCVTLSAGAHVLLSAAPLPWTTVALVFTGVFAVALGLAGDSERSWASIAGLLVPLHLAADTAFTGGQAACYGEGGGPVTGPLRLLGFDLICGGGDLGAPLGPVAGDPAGPLLLLAAHLALALAAATWLRCGERALGRVLAAAVAAAFRPLRLALALAQVAAPRPRPLPRAARWRRVPPALPPLLFSVVRRGPPEAALAR